MNDDNQNTSSSSKSHKSTASNNILIAVVIIILVIVIAWMITGAAKEQNKRTNFLEYYARTAKLPDGIEFDTSKKAISKKMVENTYDFNSSKNAYELITSEKLNLKNEKALLISQMRGYSKTMEELRYLLNLAEENGDKELREWTVSEINKKANESLE